MSANTIKHQFGSHFPGENCMPPKNINIDLDLTGQFCPMAFVKFRLYADGVSPGTKFSVAFEPTSANEPLVRSITALGHKVHTTMQPETSPDQPQTKVILVEAC
jgi:TusA-related sulfurtransferase